MSVQRVPVSRSARRLTMPGLLLLVAMAAACAAPARIEVPAELPLRTNDQLFAFEWALQREATVVRAVGRVRPSFLTEARLTLALFGVDANGAIASRGITYLRSPFSAEAFPFTVALTPTGRETSFVLRVLEYHLPGQRMR
jgi:hypothetical protein